MQRYETTHNTPTGEILHLKAIQFWNRLPYYQGKPVPRFSNGWLAHFKSRHGIQQRNRHGEAASADDRGEQTMEIMAEIRETTQSYNPEDSFNIDDWLLLEDDT